MKQFFRLILSLIVLVALVLPFAQPKSVMASSTLRIYSSLSNAGILNTSNNYTIARTSANGSFSTTNDLVIGQIYAAPTYFINRSYLIFDTSPIPDTVIIESASLHIRGYEDDSATDFDIVVQTGNNTYPSDPVVLSDYNYNLYSDNFSQLNTANFSASGYNNFTLSAAGIATVNVTGSTRFALRSSRDINGNTPTGNEYVRVYPTLYGTSSDPYLEITYLATTDIVTTNDATDIVPTTATLQGTLLSTSNQSFVSVFFQHGSTTSYGTTTAVQNVVTTGTFSQGISYLQYNQTYHFRAVAKVGSIYFYGQDYYFTTMPAVGSNTDLRIVSVAVFSDYLEDGDRLFTAEVINTYTGYYPNADPKKYFTIQLLDTNNTDILGATPLYSWGDRPVSIYVNAASAGNLTDLSGYYIKMIGTLVPTNPSVSRQLTVGDWYGYDFSGALDDWCKGTAINMELSDGRADYLTNLTDQGLTITDAAGGYFTTGIPGITTVRPNLFTTSQITPNIIAGVADNQWDKSDTDPLGWRSYLSTNASDNTSGIPGDVARLAGPFGVTGQEFMVGVVTLAIFGVVMSVVGATGGWGALGALLIAIPVLWIGTWFRIMPLWVMTLIIFAFGWFYIRQFWIKTL